jgi:hypothetical protein
MGIKAHPPALLSPFSRRPSRPCARTTGSPPCAPTWASAPAGAQPAPPAHATQRAGSERAACAPAVGTRREGRYAPTTESGGGATGAHGPARVDGHSGPLARRPRGRCRDRPPSGERRPVRRDAQRRPRARPRRHAVRRGSRRAGGTSAASEASRTGVREALRAWHQCSAPRRKCRPTRSRGEQGHCWKLGAHPRLTSRGVGEAEDAAGLSDHLVGEAPFVVVPGHHLDQRAVYDPRQLEVDDGGTWVADDVRGDQGIL